MTHIQLLSNMFSRSLIICSRQINLIWLYFRNLEISSCIVLKSPKGGKHTNSISCIIADTIKERVVGGGSTPVEESPGEEFLIAGSYDGTISVWEIGQKSIGADG